MASGKVCAEERAPDLSPIKGSWQGPWYRGMSSGIMTLRIAPDGHSNVTFSNLESFGEASVELRHTTFDGKTIGFRAPGASALEFDAALNLSSDGAKLRGFAKYEGFKFRVELEKQN